MNHTNTLDKLTNSLHASELLALKLRRLKIENYKGIDNLEIDFPSPDFKDEADITVIGSCNGIGKTSILECCTLLIEYVREELQDFRQLHSHLSINIPDLLIRAGCKKASITGVFQLAQNKYHIHLILSDSGKIIPDPKLDLNNLKHKIKELSLKTRNQSHSSSFLSFLLGSNLEPMINPLLLYFHSYRKIQEGNPELGMLSEEKNQNLIPLTRRLVRRELTLSTFKAEILRSLMAKAQLFENLDVLESDKLLNKLNDLVKEFANGKIEQLRFLPDNTIEFRVSPLQGGKSFPFDGLSSGQKEIIATLFLIWKSTLSQPAIVLIDEPELHLNAEWHSQFIRYLYKLAPHNQYIIATHSQYIAESVEPYQRLLLEINS